MTLDELRKAKVLVVGLGRSGMAAVELLCREGVCPTATDVKPPEEMPEIVARLEQLGVRYGVQGREIFLGKDLIVLSPGVPADLGELAAVRERAAKVIGELELASKFLQGSIIGITGSNGKTTTTALTGHILEHAGLPVQVGGNIGNPPTNMVSDSRDGKWNVLELSSFQLETIQQFRAPIAAVLNITPDHLDRHHTMEQYIAAKHRLLETQRSGDAVILNANDEQCRNMAGAAKGRVVWFSSTGSVDEGASIQGDVIVYDGEVLMPLADIPLRGLHNAENVMAAAAAAHLAGVPLNAIAEAVRKFPGVEHRLEFVRTLDGVDYFNDSKATNVDATLKALDAFSGGLWVILGGRDKGSDYSVLRQPLASKAHAALLVGAASSKIADHLGGAVEVVDCETIDGAVAVARRRAQPGDTVLLAPACASFDQFSSYEHRGRRFKQLLNELASEGDSPEEAREESCA
jgi:UDP-N-acetylmuramoylalanine--D-glutamate ligase